MSVYYFCRVAIFKWRERSTYTFFRRIRFYSLSRLNQFARTFMTKGALLRQASMNTSTKSGYGANSCADMLCLSTTSSNCKMATLILFWGLQFSCERENAASVLCSFKNWMSTKLFTNKLRQFASLCEEKMSWAVLVKVDRWNQEVCHSFY